MSRLFYRVSVFKTSFNDLKCWDCRGWACRIEKNPLIMTTHIIYYEGENCISCKGTGVEAVPLCEVL